MRNSLAKFRGLAIAAALSALLCACGDDKSLEASSSSNPLAGAQPSLIESAKATVVGFFTGDSGGASVTAGRLGGRQ